MQSLEVLPAHDVPIRLKGVPVALFRGHIKACCVQVAGVQAHSHARLVIHVVNDVPAAIDMALSLR